MPYKIILAFPLDLATASSVLDAAYHLARDFGGEVDVLHVRADPTTAVPMLGEGMSGAMAEEIIAQAERHESETSASLRRIFDETASRYGGAATVPGHWREETGSEEETVATEGRVADLLVLPRPTATGPQASLPIINAALLDTGRPLLLVPPGTSPAIGRHIAIFWNDSPQVARAIAAAMPLLEKAERVTVLVAPQENDSSPERPVAYLARHGIKAAHSIFTTGVAGGEVGRGLLAEAGKAGADLVVMGAFSRSKLRQLILGGVTRYVIGASTIPVLLCR
jgi:nucleotide-binding universal stress UspA family protein